MKLQLEVVGKLPQSVKPTQIRVEPEKGTFGLYGAGNPGEQLASGQFNKAGDLSAELRREG